MGGLPLSVTLWCRWSLKWLQKTPFHLLHPMFFFGCYFLRLKLCSRRQWRIKVSCLLWKMKQTYKLIELEWLYLGVAAPDESEKWRRKIHFCLPFLSHNSPTTKSLPTLLLDFFKRISFLGSGNEFLSLTAHGFFCYQFSDKK